MILYPPVRFDANEWFFIGSTVVTWTIMFLLPKRFSLLTVLVIWVFNYFLGQTADFTIAVKPYDLYDFGDREQFEFFDLLMYIFTYPPGAYFVLYLYDRWRLKGWKLAGYILLCAIVTTIMEWMTAEWFHVFTYKGWKVLYSCPVYVFVYTFNILLLRFVQRYIPRKAHMH